MAKMVRETNSIWIPAMGEVIEPKAPGICVPESPDHIFRCADIPLPSFMLSEIGRSCETLDFSEGIYQSLGTNRLDEMIHTVQDLLRLEELVATELNNWTLVLQHKEDHAEFPALEDIYRMSAEQLAAYCVEVPPKDFALLEKLLEQKRRFKAIRVLIERIIAIIRSSLDKNSRNICRLHRTLRTWFLFHGSHPPETCATPIIRVSAGCAFI